MKFHSIKYTELPIFPKLIRDYLASSPALSPFFKYPFDFKSFSQVIDGKRFSDENRQVLSETLRRQYATLETTPAVKKNIEKLSKTGTFTITTAHQPVLFTGPLYVVYKTISAIHLAARLCEEFPGNHFVPVYFMGAEDHDFAEINHTWINGEKIEWQQDGKGAVGRLSTKNIIPLIDIVQRHLNGAFADETLELLRTAYGNHSTLAEATLFLMNRLFGEFGLIILNPDDPRLKSLFAPVITAELSHQHSFKLAEQTKKELSALGYEPQVNPREINFFYLAENTRERIVLNHQTGRYDVLNTALSYSKEEILNLAQQHPENFSPNVMLRPLYQETILPNLAYVGGAGELSYWLQQKRIFDHYGVNFPMLVLRNSAMLVDPNTYRKITKSGIQFSELFDDQETMVQNFIRRTSNSSLSFNEEKEQASVIFESIREKAIDIDPSLSGAIEAHKAAFIKGIEGLETKIMRAEKRKSETAISQITHVKSKLFPDNLLQERRENFLPWYAKDESELLRQLRQEFDPFRREFLIIVDED